MLAMAVTTVSERPGFFHEKQRVLDPPLSGFTAVNGRVPSPPSHPLNGNAKECIRPPESQSPELSSLPTKEAPAQGPLPEKRPVVIDEGRGPSLTPPSNARADSVASSLCKRKRTDSEVTDANGMASRDPEYRLLKRLESRESNHTNGMPRGLSHMSDDDVGSHGGEVRRSSLPMNGDRDDRSWHSRQQSDEAGIDARTGGHSRQDSLVADSDPGAENDELLDQSVVDGQCSPPEFSGQRTAAGVQVDPKKRKRTFSNRTKTGCQTCRRRKKKCDEGKPECRNCLRGGFTCEGYIAKAGWQKSSSIHKMPLAIGVRDGLLDQAQKYQAPVRPREVYIASATINHHDSRSRPLASTDDREQPGSRGQRPAWPEPTYLSEQLPRTDYSRVPPLADLNLNEQRERGGPLGPIQGPHHAPRQPYQSPESRRLNNPQPAAATQLAVQYQNNHHKVPAQIQHTEPPAALGVPGDREKMLQGSRYQPYSQELVEDREVCKANLWRFNEVNNPIKAISHSERQLKFRAVLELGMPRALINRNHPSRLGSGVRVEAPFTCEFGYNITIGDEVVIGANCTIMDSGKVHIGAHSFLGPGVTILTSTLSTDPKCRALTNREAVAKSVIIGENVFVGGSVTILPGVNIGKNSTVGAGSVVTRDVPPNVVVFGNPARIQYDAPGSDHLEPAPSHANPYPPPSNYQPPSNYPKEGYRNDSYGPGAGPASSAYHPDDYRQGDYRPDDRYYDGPNGNTVRNNGPARVPPGRGVEGHP